MEDSGKGRHTPYNLTSLYWGSLLEALEAANRAEVFGQWATGAPGRHSAPRPIESSSQEVPWHACVLTPAESPATSNSLLCLHLVIGEVTVRPRTTVPPLSPSVGRQFPAGAGKEAELEESA